MTVNRHCRDVACNVCECITYGRCVYGRIAYIPTQIHLTAKNAEKAQRTQENSRALRLHPALPVNTKTHTTCIW